MIRFDRAMQQCRRRAWSVMLLAAAGCGGLGQDDMRRYALQRPSDEELAGNTSPAKVNSVPPAVVSFDSAGSTDPPATRPAAEGPVPASTTNPTSGTADWDPDRATGPNAAHRIEHEPISTTISDTRSPDPNLSITERRQMTIDNMTRIVQALEAYRKTTGNYPGFAIHSAHGQPLLSWRVELLPYLGYQALYDEFRRDEPWDSDHNRRLLPNIPAVYQSPDRFDENTNYLVPVGRGTAFSGPRGNHPRRWEDGLVNIVLLLEVDDAAAVPWTAPREWTFDPRSPGRSLGNLRSDGFFAGWGEGNVARVPRETPVADVCAMFTVDGGEPFQVQAVCQAALAELAQAESDTATQSAIHSPTSEVRQAQLGGVFSAHTALHPYGSPRASTARFEPSGGASQPSPRWSEQRPRSSSLARDIETAQWLFAAFLTDDRLATLADYQWIPALRRPALSVTFGLGADYTGPGADAVRRQLAPTDDPARRLSSQWTTVIGELAQPLLDELAAFTLSPPAMPAASAASGHVASNGSRGSDAPLTVIGVAPSRRLVRAAQLADVDLLLLFDIQDKTTRTGVQSKSVQFSVWDTWRGREVFRLPRINYLRLRHAEPDPLARNPIDEALGSFSQFMREQLQPQPLPAALTAERAAQRISQLAAMKRDNPLPLLSEMKFYHENGLVSAEQLLSGYESLAGAKAAAALVAGTVEEKWAVLSEWLRF